MEWERTDVKRALTLPLSYGGVESRRWDSNPRPCMFSVHDELLTITSPKSGWFRAITEILARPVMSCASYMIALLQKVEPVPPIQHPSQALCSEKMAAPRG